MLCHSIYLQVVKVHLFNLGLPMNCFTFVLPSENPQMPFILNRQGHLVDQIFCKDEHESLKYVDEFFELKNDEIQKEHASLSLYLSIDRKYAKCRTKADAHDKMGFQYISISVDIVRSHARIQRGDRGSGHPHLKNHKLSNRPDPLKFSKLPSQHSTLGHHRHASETP